MLHENRGNINKDEENEKSSHFIIDKHHCMLETICIYLNTKQKILPKLF
jgi:hypothetical protein